MDPAPVGDGVGGATPVELVETSGDGVGVGFGVGVGAAEWWTRDGWAIRGAISGLADAPLSRAVPMPYAAATANADVVTAVATTRFQLMVVPFSAGQNGEESPTRSS